MEVIMDTGSREYEVCLCRHVTRGEIEDFVEETGILDLKEVCEKLNIGNKCGACREMIQEIIDSRN
jgi:bacterioferritin-associated ferredoxin